MEDLFRDRTITHRTIDDDPSLHNRIVQDIATYVLPKLTEPTLSANSPNVLSIAGQTSIAGQASAVPTTSGPSPLVSVIPLAEADAVSTPEPSVLLALGTIGTGLWRIKRQRL